MFIKVMDINYYDCYNKIVMIANKYVNIIICV